MTSHQAKKLDVSALKAFRDRFALPLSDDDVAALRFYKPADESPGIGTPVVALATYDAARIREVRRGPCL